MKTNTCIVIDIETGPAPDALDNMPIIEAPANYVNPEKIAKFIEEKKLTLLEKAALDPITGCVLAFTSAFDDEPPGVLLGREYDIIIQAISQLNDCAGKGIPIIGFRSRGFDLLFLIRRAWILGIPVPIIVQKLLDKYNTGHIDLLQVWLCGSPVFEGQSLDRICKAAGLGIKEGIGADFAELLKTDPEKAKAYAINDVVLTRALANRILPK